MSFIIEIATTDFATTKAAAEGGADRIEVCAALTEGGITASPASLKRCREAFDLPLFPIIRPRPGDFLYSDDEFEIMLQDVKFCRQLGFDGVVFGLLNADGSIDIRRTAILVQAAYPMEVTFHRAFDRCRNLFEALEQLITLGVQRILTSGQKPTAPEGAELIAQLVKAADERIIIMPGSGVRKENIAALAATGAREFHASLRGLKPSSMNFKNAAFSEADYQNPCISAGEIGALRQALMAN